MYAQSLLSHLLKLTTKVLTGVLVVSLTILLLVQSLTLWGQPALGRFTRPTWHSFLADGCNRTQISLNLTLLLGFVFITPPLLVSSHLFFFKSELCNPVQQHWGSQLTCKMILDSVAPLKTRNPRVNCEPWLNDNTRAASRVLQSQAQMENGQITLCHLKY